MSLSERTLKTLTQVTDAMAAGEDRPGQREMADAAARAIVEKRHLIVQAGTGTGKSLAYLAPLVENGRPAVIATATKALQDQLRDKDLPLVAASAGRPFTFVVLKGRSNYLCLQRAHEIQTTDEQLGLDGVDDRAPREEIDELLTWADESLTGDRADLSAEPSPRAWAAVSVSGMECPGATKCPKGEVCFAETARAAAHAADIVVVNTHLYGLDLATNGAILPDHEVVVLDEAHQVEDIFSATSGWELGEGRFSALGRLAGAIVADDDLVRGLRDAGEKLTIALQDDVGRRVRRLTDDKLVTALDLGRRRGADLIEALRRIDDNAPGDVGARKQRAMSAATHLVEDISATLEVGGPEVVWVEGTTRFPRLRVAPLDVGEMLAERLWDRATVILTSATVPSRLGERLGMDPDTYDTLDVGSPFDYESNAMLYCAAHLPEPRSPQYEEALYEELETLIGAAGGRTLALFTSWRVMDAAAEALHGRLPGRLLTQRDLPKPALLRAFSDDPSSSLFATMGFWQGVDVPGPALQLVTIDKIPFPRPDEPLLQARREQARADSFGRIDLPIASTLLAQGVGRLIRTQTDRGVVAVLDARLASARYRWELVNALPPMPRVKDLDEAVSFLEGLDRAALDEAALEESAPDAVRQT